MVNFVQEQEIFSHHSPSGVLPPFKPLCKPSGKPVT